LFIGRHTSPPARGGKEFNESPVAQSVWEGLNGGCALRSPVEQRLHSKYTRNDQKTSGRESTFFVIDAPDPWLVHVRVVESLPDVVGQDDLDGVRRHVPNAVASLQIADDAVILPKRVSN